MLFVRFSLNYPSLFYKTRTRKQRGSRGASTPCSVKNSSNLEGRGGAGSLSMKGNLVRGGGGEGKNGVKSLFFLLFCLIFFALLLFCSCSLICLSLSLVSFKNPTRRKGHHPPRRYFPILERNKKAAATQTRKKKAHFIVPPLSLLSLSLLMSRKKEGTLSSLPTSAST